jgi:hypothetical protein
LGYEKSDNLYYLSNVNICEELSWHDRRVINELSPYAVYVVDGTVLVAFFDDLHERANTDIQCKIWNAQIPVIISDEGNWIKIYNGKSIKESEKNNVCLSHIANYNMEECDEKNVFSYWNITNNISLGLYEKNLGRKDLNDSLIENLRYITTELKEKYQISFANKLVLRVLFVRYLIDRGVCIGYKGLDSNIKKSQEIFLDIVKQKSDFFSLFRFLKEEFNGNLFEMDEEKEWQEISDSALAMLYDFLTAQTDMKTGQLWLFPFYDFNIIPIELISNIYEILLGKERQDKDKAFYTPEYLADYIIQRTVGKYLIDNSECTVFDPSCGSGIFLVKSLRRILEKNASEDGYIRDQERINRLIKDNIYGVDYNEEAVDVTIFSLYVTLFDYQDPKKLKDFKLPLLKGHNILFGDFFDQDVISPITNIRFKYIVGNPPWGRVHQERYKEYCKSKNVIPQDGEICVAFLLKVQDVGDENTECSLVIPSKILYKGKKPSCDFRKNLLSNVCMQQVLEISAVRKQIFKGAIAPAAVVSFMCKKAVGNHKVEYISLKPNRYLKMFGIIMIEPDDIKYIIQEQLLNNDWLWKVLVYGGYWDYELIKSFYKKNPSIEDVAKEYGLKMGKGVEDHVGDGQDASHLVGRKIIASDGCIEPFALSTDNSYTFTKDKIHRVREKDLFEPPYILFKKGLNCENYSIRAAYTEERLLYKATVSCIKGSENDKNILLNLEGLLNSSLFTYLNFMLGSSVGIEREQIFLNELIKFPYVYSDKLVELVKKMHLAIQDDSAVEDIQVEINNCVFEMYGVQNNYFVDYAINVQIPMLCGKYIEAKCNAAMLMQYAEVFLDVWRKRLERSNLRYSIKLYPDIKGKFAAFYMKLSFDAKNSDINVVDDVEDNVKILTDFMIYKLNDCFYQTKNVAEFDDDAFVIVKPIDAKNWHGAMAIKDSYKVLNAVLLGEGDCQ